MFQATIKLAPSKKGPSTHTGFKGRVISKGESFTTTSPEEAAYYEAQSGFSVVMKKGRLRSRPKEEEPEEPVADESEESDESDDDAADDDESDGDEEEREPEVKGAYEKRDLKKMTKEALLELIKNDRDLPLKVRDVPKNAGKREIIDMILEAQAGNDD
jgi:hypothetical protein